LSLHSLENFFKPEVRSSGAAFVAKGKVSITRPSDLQIECYIRASTAFKVTLQANSMESDEIYTHCSCNHFQKGKLCKHIWSSILAAESQYPDFFETRTDLIQKSSTFPKAQPGDKTKPLASQKFLDFQVQMKEKQKTYRKAQYEKQKERVKAKRGFKESVPVAETFPPEIEAALNYLEQNGFSLRASLTKEAVTLATRKLSRIFHPDVGGSHAEITELNHHSRILNRFIERGS